MKKSHSSAERAKSRQDRPEVRRRVNQRENKQNHSAVQCKVADRGVVDKWSKKVARVSRDRDLQFKSRNRTKLVRWAGESSVEISPNLDCWLGRCQSSAFRRAPRGRGSSRLLDANLLFLSTLDINLRFHARPEDSFTRLDIPHSSSSVFIIC